MPHRAKSQALRRGFLRRKLKADLLQASVYCADALAQPGKIRFHQNRRSRSSSSNGLPRSCQERHDASSPNLLSRRRPNNSALSGAPCLIPQFGRTSKVSPPGTLPTSTWVRSWANRYLSSWPSLQSDRRLQRRSATLSLLTRSNAPTEFAKDHVFFPLTANIAKVADTANEIRRLTAPATRGNLAASSHMW